VGFLRDDDEHAHRVGRYLLGRRLGTGRTGVVFAAIDPELGRHLAVEVIDAPPRVDEQDASELRLHQAHAAARLVHPNVVRIHDVGRDGDRLFVAMELVDGPSLRQWLARPRPWREVLAVMRQAAAGLAAAHDAGILHLDVRPEHIVIASDGRVVVSGFGAGDRRALRSPSDVANGGYAAPELAAGRELDARTDQYGLCLVLREALFGTAPADIAGPEPSTPPPRRSVPGWVRRAVQRGLAPSPDDRYPDLHALRSALDPARRRGPMFAAIGATGFVTAIAIAVMTPTDDHSSVAFCDRVTEHVEGVWNQGLRAQIEATFLATAEPSAPEAWAAIAARVTAFTEAWISAQNEVCQAHLRADVAPQLIARRETCLERQLGKAAAILDALRGANRDTVLRSSAAVDGLGSPSGCLDDAALSRDEQARSHVAPAVRAELDRLLNDADILRETSRHDDALRVAESALAQAQAANDGWAAAEASLTIAYVRSWIARATAEQAFHDAFSAALASNHHHVATLAMIGLVEQWAPTTVGGLESAEQWVRHCEAALAAHPDPGSEVHLRVAIGTAYLTAGRYAEGTAAYEQAIAAARPGVDDYLLANVQTNLGALEASRGHHTASLDRFRKGLELFLSVYGPRHPSTAAAILNVGSALAELGELDAARDEHLRALAVLQQNFGADHVTLTPALRMLAWSGLMRRAFADALPYAERALAISRRDDPRGESTARSLLMLSNLELELGRVDAAHDHAASALEIAEAVLGADHPEVAGYAIGLAMAAVARRDEATARAQLDRAIRMRRRDFGDRDPEIGRAWAGLAELELVLGNHAAAVEAATQAYAFVERSGRPVDLAEREFLLARCLRGGGPAERERARRLADAASQRYAAAGTSWRAHVDAIATWRAGEGGRARR
jgi:tetratricopeptide (TPR) repeat protein